MTTLQKAALITGIVLSLLTSASVVGGAAYFTGRVVRSIEVVSVAVADHEGRIRDLESSLNAPSSPRE